MRDLLLAAERAGQPVGGPSRAVLAGAMREAQQAYLRTLLGRRSDGPSDEELRILRGHAGYLDLLGDEVGEDQASDAFFVAGTIFEWLARLGPGEPLTADVSSLATGAVGDLIRASLAYSSGKHDASSALAARRALVLFAERRDDHPITGAAARMILEFLAREFGSVLDTHLRYGDAVRVTLQDGFAGDIDWSAIALTSRAAEACSIASAACSPVPMS
jgi:hypothetical protein